MFAEWLAKGLEKPGKTQDGLAAVLGVDRSVISKIINYSRQLKAEEIPKVAGYIEEAPPDRIMPVQYTVGAGWECFAVDTDDPQDYQSVSGMWGVEAALAVVKGDSMRPLFEDGTKLFFGTPRPPMPTDHNRMRIVRLADDRLLVKVMKRTADPAIWDLDSFNAPPMEGRVVVAVAEIIRIDPKR